MGRSNPESQTSRYFLRSRPKTSKTNVAFHVVESDNVGMLQLLEQRHFSNGSGWNPLSYESSALDDRRRRRHPLSFTSPYLYVLWKVCACRGFHGRCCCGWAARFRAQWVRFTTKKDGRTVHSAPHMPHDPRRTCSSSCR